MKRTALLLILTVLFAGCKSIEKNKKTPTPQVITDARTGKPMLVGAATRQDLQKPPFDSWFNDEYYTYIVDTDILDTLKDKNFDVTIVMGTWCPDSRREVPRFYRIMDEIDFPADKIKLITVDRDKKAGKLNIRKLNIERIPTFIFYKNGKEIGRIVESPVESLEADMVKIINGNN